jgi:hypothetical protein
MASIQTKLVPGTYRLTEDLPPLVNDKRRSRDWKCCPMKRGQLFFYTEWTYAPDEERPERMRTEHRLYPLGSYQHDSVSPDLSSATRVLEECLERVDETPGLWFRREHSGGSPFGAIDELCKQGRFSLQDFKDAVESYYANLKDE